MSDETATPTTTVTVTPPVPVPVPETLAGALARAQGEFPPIARTRTVRVRTKAGSTYVFDYAPLDVVLAAVRPCLARHGLAIYQTLEDGGVIASYILHERGESLRSVIPFRSVEGGWQDFGNALTYARRYGLALLLGVAPESDDDGNAADGNTAVVAPRPPVPVPALALGEEARKRLNTALEAAGIPAHHRLGWCQKVVGRPLKTSKDLLVSDEDALAVALDAMTGGTP